MIEPARTDPAALVDLDGEGHVLNPSTLRPVNRAALPDHFRRNLVVPYDATDITVFVHGWNTPPDKANQRADALAASIARLYNSAPGRYPAMTGYRPYLVIVRWPSSGRYRKMRDRAHAVSVEGNAAVVIEYLLGYLNTERRIPNRKADRLRTAGGQYLHCIGHSFGGRFLCQAIQESAPTKGPSLAWPWGDDRFPYVVDSLLILQMAARPDSFATTFRRLVSEAPLNCPIVLTKSSSDHATGIWHRLAEGRPGIGHVGARAPKDLIINRVLRPPNENYTREELKSRIVNVDASKTFRRGRFLLPQGAHSDIDHPETAHLHLTLADLAR